MRVDKRAVAAHFGKNLRRQRLLAKISQEELGRRASVHGTEISILERGQREPRISTVVKLAVALSIPPMDLLEGIE
jgi:transcriptional regulator with XRE-family HTH domain